jgi:hypothetical protein
MAILARPRNVPAPASAAFRILTRPIAGLLRYVCGVFVLAFVLVELLLKIDLMSYAEIRSEQKPVLEITC